MRRLLLLLFIATSFIAVLGLLAPGCANIIPPTGGPRDSAAPVLMRASPDNFTTNFTGRTINLQFDEYVQLNELQSELVVNPPQERYPQIRSNLRNVSIKLLDTLQPNTTYSLQFGNAIQDVNENNPAKNFTYVFSTGPYLDSLTLSGYVVDAKTGLPDSTLTIMMHTTVADSAVAKQNPRFATRPDGRGFFQFSFLPSGTFYLFAINDAGTKKYLNPATPFAFYPQPVVVPSPDSLYELRAFMQEEDNRPAVARQSGGNTLSGRAARREDRSFRLSSPENRPEVDVLDTTFIAFTNKIASFDSTKIRLTDTLFATKQGLVLQLDSTRRNVNLFYPFAFGQEYRLIVQRGFATDTTGAINPATDTLNLKVKAESEYGSAKIDLANVDYSRNPILQWVLNDEVVMQTTVKEKTVRIPIMRPGQYKMRLLYDENNNGRWDPGNYWEGRQPERVLALTATLNVRSNWDNEFEIDW